MFSPRVSHGGPGSYRALPGDLNRTQMPFRDIGVQYKTNGTGRDLYIFHNNGGFSDASYSPNLYDHPGAMLPKIRGRAFAEKKPTIHSKSVYYR